MHIWTLIMSISYQQIINNNMWHASTDEVNPELTNVIHTCTCIIKFQGDRISFSGQVKNYQNTVQQVVNLLGNQDQAANYLSRCIYSIGLGSNDYLNNYFQPLYYSTGRQYTPEQYADLLIQQYTQQLQVPESLRPLFFPLWILK